MPKIEPRKLFSKEILNYKVKTQKMGEVSYVNLDNAATTPPFAFVEDGIEKYLESYGSVHRGAGKKSKVSTDIYEKSREIIKDFVGAPQDSYVIYTANTTEAMNTAAYFFSFLKGKVAVSSIEHSSSWLPWIKAEGVKALGAERFYFGELEEINRRLQILGRDQVLQYNVNENFEFDLAEIEKLLIENKVKVLVVTASSNITGYCPPIKEIGEIAHKHGAYFLVDACQYLQHHKINMQEMGIDFLAASGHKFYAPFGGGFLIGSKKFLDEFLPYQIGGGNLPYITKEGEFLRYKNQMAHDPGTPNAVGAVAMSLALQKLDEIGIDNIQKYENALSQKVFGALSQNKKVRLYVRREHLSTVITFSIDGIDSVEVAERLNEEYGIGVRAGSFCVYQVVRELLGIQDESEIIDSVRKGSTERIPSLVRASIGLCNSEEDIDRFIEAISEITS
jgi:cysteine desulfurase